LSLLAHDDADGDSSALLSTALGGVSSLLVNVNRFAPLLFL
jgi:hypothetical protein